MNQIVFKEEGLGKALIAILEKEKPKTIFLVYGKSSFEVSGAKVICDKVLANYDVVPFSDFSPNPKLEEIERGIIEHEKQSADLIIAIGGGSTLDVAKSVNFICAEKKGLKKGQPLVAVPTTSGSGSEATKFTVFYKGNEKMFISDENVIPDYVILDPALTTSLSKESTAHTGLDAICQAIESFWSINHTDESRELSKKSLSLTLPSIEKVVNKSDFNSRKCMLEGAYYAGEAINISKTTACHAMAYALTTNFGIPHGHAVALTMPQMLVFNDNKEVNNLLNCKTSEDASSMFTQLIKNLGLKTQLREFGIKDSDIEMLADQLSLERAGNNPLSFGPAEAKKMLSAII